MVLALIFIVLCVSALAAEWIEIAYPWTIYFRPPVSVLAAEWIKILLNGLSVSAGLGLRPRGGVD